MTGNFIYKNTNILNENNNLSNENVLVIGDYNDELDDDTDDNVFQNFIDDSDNYLFADMIIATGNPQNFSFPNWPSHIDHILISNELFDEFNSNESDITTIQVDNYISGGFSSYDALITDHMPVGISSVQAVVWSLQKSWWEVLGRATVRTGILVGSFQQIC